MNAPGKRRRWLEWFGLIFIAIIAMNLVWAAFVYFYDYKDPSLRNTVEERMDFCGAVVYEKTGSNSSSSFCVEKDEDGRWRRLDMRLDPKLCPNDNRALQKRECYVIKSQEE
ncbi:MAG: hypothetical protein WBM45_12875 [Woeseiaceae bacterium]